MSTMYNGKDLGKGTKALEMFKRKDFKALDTYLKERNNEQKAHLARFYKMPEEREEFEKTVQFYGLT